MDKENFNPDYKGKNNVEYGSKWEVIKGNNSPIKRKKTVENKGIYAFTNNKKGTILALLAAALYSISSPFSKILLSEIPPVILAGLLYIGAGVGMGVIFSLRKLIGIKDEEASLEMRDFPYVVLMVVLDILAPILLLLGLSMTTAANTSLLNNFEIVATSFIAMSLFGEKISTRLWIGICAVTVACAILSIEDAGVLNFSTGSILVVAAACLWGFENNCTKKISHKNPLQIVLIKGIFSGSASLIIGLSMGEKVRGISIILVALVLGFISYGLSIFSYVYGQRLIGAARTGAYYSVTPFIGGILSLVIFREIPKVNFFIAFVIMIIGAWLSYSDEPLLKKSKSKDRLT